MTPNAIALPEQKPEAMTALEVARAFAITSDADYLMADSYCVGLKELEKSILSDFEEPKKKAAEAHKAIVAQEKKHLEPVTQARAIYKDKMGSWQEAQRKAAEAQAELDRIAAKKAAEDEALARAARAAEFGDDKTADEIINTPVIIEPVKAAPASPKSQTVFRTIYDYEITDASLIPREYLTPDLVKIGHAVKTMRAETVIPGIRVFTRETVVRRGA